MLFALTFQQEYVKKQFYRSNSPQFFGRKMKERAKNSFKKGGIFYPQKAQRISTKGYKILTGHVHSCSGKKQNAYN